MAQTESTAGFKAGKLLDSHSAIYEVLRAKPERVPLGSGRSGVTYLARIKRVMASRRLSVNQRVVIKMPLIDGSEPYQVLTALMAELYRKFTDEFVALQRLTGLRCAARVLDFGAYPHKLAGEPPLVLLFMVQEHVDGELLTEHMARCFKRKGEDHFRGLTDGDLYLEWARRLASSLLAIHQRQVVHGDIWQQNIMIRRSSTVFIDFGQALLRDAAPPATGLMGSSKRFVPPEGSGTIAADVFCFGVVLYYLATGADAPSVEHLRDIDQLKVEITKRLKRENRELFDSNRGIVDLIARCLRFDESDRSASASEVLESVRVLRTNYKPRSSQAADLARRLKGLEERSPLFSRVAQQQLRRVDAIVRGMDQGVYDLSGSREHIVSVFLEYLAGLRRNDLYLTLSVPFFWGRQGLGTNGRVLSMNALAAQRGATIRRLFLVTEPDDQELKRILYYHWQVKQDLDALPTPPQTEEPDVKAGGYWTGILGVDQREYEQLKARGMNNYGVLVTRGRGVLIFPVYRRDGRIHTILFRTDPKLVSAVKKEFLSLLARPGLRAWSSFGSPGPLDE